VLKNNLKLYILLAFFSGYFISDVLINNENGFMPNATADVGGYGLLRPKERPWFCEGGQVGSKQILPYTPKQ